MIKNVLQCCYTNASRETGDIVSSGWQAVCVSPGLPLDAFSTCTRIQNANSSIHGTMTDENGNVLNLLEICGDGSFVYVVRTQYGLLDRLGRANMFSHAYIFPCKDSSMIIDPNTFLTLANDNFKDNEESATEYSDELSRIPAFNISEAMKCCDLDKARLLILVKSVYAQMLDEKMAKPLYIQYDGTEESLRAFLFCIYYAMPLSLRKRLSVASVKTDNTNGKNIIFSKNASEQELHFIPATGESTILTERIERRLSRLGFLDVAIDNITHPEIQQNFKALEDKTIELGDATGSKELIMKIAHIQLNNEDLCDIGDSELDIRLSDALRSNSLGNSAMNEYIALLLSEITTRKLLLTDENETALAERVEANSSGSLFNAAEEYNFYKINILPTSEAASQLSRMSEIVFLNYRTKHINSDKGRKILDHYYAEIMLRESGNSWDGVQKVVDATADMPVKPLTDDKIDECAWRLYFKSLDGIKDGYINHIVSEYRNYMGIMRQRLDERKISECGYAAREAFWEQLSYDDINFSMLYFYRAMVVQSKKCQRLVIYCSLPSKLMASGEIGFFKAANAFFSDAYINPRTKYISAEEKVIAEAKKVSSHPNKYFELWCRVMFDTRANLPFNDLINLYSSSETSDINEILNYFNRFVISCNEAKISPSIKKEVAKIVSSICTELDSDRNPVPLDGWLLLGGCLYANCFYILDDLRPHILNENEIDVVANSNLIRKCKFDANKYIQDHGREYRIVKKWLSALQYQMRAEDTRNGVQESNQGFIGRGMSALSKLTQGEQRHSAATKPAGQQDDAGKVRFDNPEHTNDSENIPDRKSQSMKKGLFSGLFEKK